MRRFVISSADAKTVCFEDELSFFLASMRCEVREDAPTKGGAASPNSGPERRILRRSSVDAIFKEFNLWFVAFGDQNVSSTGQQRTGLTIGQ
jgi:hypothetical protein